MIARLAKSMACFFVKNELVEAEDEEVYAYGMEILFSTVFNLLIASGIAIATNTFLPCLINLTAFVTIRIYAGGYHANTHEGCMLTLIAVQSLFVIIIKTVPFEMLKMCIPFMIIFSVVTIFRFAPVAHPNKPLSDSLKLKLRRKAYISMLLWLVFTITFMIIGKCRISFYSAFGMFTVSMAMIAEMIALRRENRE